MITHNQPREIYWTEAAKGDIMWMRIKRREWDVIKAEVERIAEVHNLCLDHAVCRVAQTNGRWFRLKITRPSQIRVFFSATDKRIIVRAIFRRAERTYDWIEILFKTGR